MTNDISHVRSMIMLFVMASCPACQDYKPRFEKLVKGFKAHGVPLVDLRPDQQVPAGSIPIVVIDAASTDPSVIALAEQYGVENLPTTMILVKNGYPTKYEGALSDQEIYDLLVAAANANR
jgi:thiol-disulfide isomerase/thioredoxin